MTNTMGNITVRDGTETITADVPESLTWFFRQWARVHKMEPDVAVRSLCSHGLMLLVQQHRSDAAVLSVLLPIMQDLATMAPEECEVVFFDIQHVLFPPDDANVV